MKQQFKDLNIKYKIQYLLCIVGFILSAIFSFFGLISPPPGIVDSSVLGLIGIWLGFVTATLGLETHYAVQLEKITQLVKETQKKSDKDDSEE